MQGEFRQPVRHMPKPFIPPDVEWFIAEVVEEFKVPDKGCSRVHINTILIRAKSADEAYEKSISRGRSAEMTFTNTEGENVEVRFRGLRGLFPVYERLEDGSELLYEKYDCLTDPQIQSFVKAREKLAVFDSGSRDEG